MKNRLLGGILLGCAILHGICAQQVFRLKNPSFEEGPLGIGVIPKGWSNAGAIGESPPDLQPGHFDVFLPAAEGEHYLGLVTRNNNTWEGVSQRLDGFLIKDSIYTFSIFLARSSTYRSLTRMSSTKNNRDVEIQMPKMVNYEAPTILNIWGYNTETGQEELLVQSVPIEHTCWRQYTFVLKPQKGAYNQLDLMAYYVPGGNNMLGNLLLDACSDIKLGSPDKTVRYQLEICPPETRSLLIENASFEQPFEVVTDTTPGWFWPEESNQDALRVERASKRTKALSGEHFAVMTLEGENTAQRIGYRLASPLSKSKLYRWAVSLGYEKKGYVSSNGKLYKDPLFLEVWGYNEKNGQIERLAKTENALDVTPWTYYTMHLLPENGDYNVLYLKVAHNGNGINGQNGHLFLDGFSPISRLYDK